MRNQSWQFDVIGGRPLPNCPYATSSIPPTDGGIEDGGRPLYHNPTTSSTFFLLGLTHLIFTLLTLFKYCQVKIFNRIIKHPSVSNYYFACFSSTLAVASIIDGVRYSLDFPHQAIGKFPSASLDGNTSFTSNNQAGSSEEEEHYIVGPDVIDSWLLLGSFIFRSAALYFLTLSLNHQRIHRSLTVPVAPLSTSHHPRISDNESTPLLVNSPTFEATPVIQAPEAELEEGGGGGSEEDDTELVTPTHDRSTSISRKFLLIQSKLAILFRSCSALYSTLYESGWLFPIISFTAAVVRISTLISIVDAVRFSDYPTNGKSSGNLDIPFLLSIIGTIIQLAPVIFLIVCIMRPGQTRTSSSQMDSIASGPTLPARFLLLVSIACTFAFWIEPSILCRIITDYILSNTRNEAMCVVPPWWWQKVKGLVMTIIPAHGWASILDLFCWIGGLGVFGLFRFMKIEYNRNADQWITATVSEVQSTFGFY